MSEPEAARFLSDALREWCAKNALHRVLGSVQVDSTPNVSRRLELVCPALTPAVSREIGSRTDSRPSPVQTSRLGDIQLRDQCSARVSRAWALGDPLLMIGSALRHKTSRRRRGARKCRATPITWRRHTYPSTATENLLDIKCTVKGESAERRIKFSD